MSQEHQACAVPIEEQMESCLAHYERVSMAAHEWNNQVPQAIRAWYAAKSASSSDGEHKPSVTEMREAIEKSGVADQMREGLSKGFDAWKETIARPEVARSDTPLCDALDKDPLDSNDLRAWRTMACQMESAANNALNALTDARLDRAASVLATSAYDYEQGDDEGDESYKLRIVGRAAQLERELEARSATARTDNRIIRVRQLMLGWRQNRHEHEAILRDIEDVVYHAAPSSVARSEECWHWNDCPQSVCQQFKRCKKA